MCIRILRQQYFGNRTRFKKYFLTPIAYDDINKQFSDKDAKIEEVTELNTFYNSQSKYSVISDEDYDILPDLLMSKINAKIATLEYYERRIMELYFYGDNKNEKKIKPLSMRSIHEATGISRHELNRVVNNFKNECNNNINWDCGIE